MEASERCLVQRIEEGFAAAAVAESVSTSFTGQLLYASSRPFHRASNGKVNHSYAACNEAQWLSSCISTDVLHGAKHAVHSVTCSLKHGDESGCSANASRLSW
jgi:hypothetical protein